MVDSTIPTSDIDLFSDAVIADPYPIYRTLRNLGPVVLLVQQNLYAITRYKDVRSVLRDYKIFSSAHGISVDEDINKLTYGNSITTDPPLHERIRKITSAPLMPKALEAIRPLIEQEAEKLIGDLFERKSFDGIRDLAWILPLKIVTEQVGVPEKGRQSMLEWGAASFNIGGPKNARYHRSLETIKGLHEYCRNEAVPGNLRPDGWAMRIYAAADRGEIPREYCPAMMREYLAPSLDTTIAATGHLLRLLGDNPDQYALVRANEDLIPAAVNEALRLETPIRSFTRYVTRDFDLEGSVISAGSRILVVFASANRDERKWEDPDAYRVERKPDSHVAFGHGIHTCAGSHLARLEMVALLRAIVRRVNRIDVGIPVLTDSNLLRAYDSLPVVFS
jgi:cytochrome P450